MKHILSFIEQNVFRQLLRFRILRIRDNYLTGIIGTLPVLNVADLNIEIYNLIQSGKPFLVGRFGGNELNMMKVLEFDIKSEKKKLALDKMCLQAGFFPNSLDAIQDFLPLMKEFCKEVDILGYWYLNYEGYFIKKYMRKDLKLSFIDDLEPWKNSDMPWTAALKGRRVLIVHPFADTIRSQYEYRDKIFQNTEILPEFELKTLKAVQTIAGETDERFDSWYDALNWMYQEGMKMDFDVAIIGCGAYGAPLAAMFKKSGKQAIHLGGATQILFGIIGRRWDKSESPHSYVQKWFNDYWVRPSEKEIPRNAKKVEEGCYW